MKLYVQHLTRIILLIIALTLCSTNCRSQQVTVSGGGTTTYLGQSYILHCFISGEPVGADLTYQWLKDGSQIDVVVETLYFTSLVASDSGFYTCIVTVNQTSTYNGTTRINIQLPSNSVAVTSDPVSPIRPIGSAITLTCTVELSPAVDIPVTVNTEWTGPDGFMASNTAQRIRSTNTYTSTVMVSFFERNKSGKYTCNATISSDSEYLSDSSNYGSKNVTTGVYLSQNGHIIQHNSNIFFTLIGTNINPLVCTSDRMPCCRDQPQFGEWKFPDGSQVKHISEHPTTFHRNRDNNGNVNLFRIESDMPVAGRTCCEIQNATDMNQTLCVNVVLVKVTHLDATPVLGQRYRLSCNLTGVGILDTDVNYQWQKNGSPVNENGHILSFTSLSLSDAGRYTCTVTLGTSSSRNYTDIVLQIPTPVSIAITSVPASPIRPVESDVTLTCTVELNPAVDVSVTVDTNWTRSDEFTVTNTAHHMSSNTTYISTVIVSPFGRDQSGIYSCTASVSSSNTYLLTSEAIVGSSRITTGVYLSHNEDVIEPDSNIAITEIDTLPPQQLACITDRKPCCANYPHRTGEWVFPNGTNVSILSANPTQFYRNRGSNGQVNLYRVSEEVFGPTGRFCCRVPDANNVSRTVCVNVVSVQIIARGGTSEFGENYSLLCTVSGADSANTLTYQWRKNNTVIQVSLDNVLTFNPIRLSDAGRYVCNVSVNMIINSNSKDLLLKFPTPAIVTITSDQVGFVSVGSTVTVQCTVVIPTFDVKVNATIHLTDPTGNILMVTTQYPSGSSNTFISTATISSFGRDQSGIYTCNVAYISPDNPFLLESDSHAETLQITIDNDKLFQLRLSRVADCLTWVDEDVLRKIEDIQVAIATNVEQRCQCGFIRDQITRSAFQCFPDSPQAVTYRAVLHGNDNTSSSEIIMHIKQWVAGRTAISVRNVLFDVDAKCIVEITSILDLECKMAAATQTSMVVSMKPVDNSSSEVVGIISGIVSAVLIITVLLSILIVIVLLLIRRRKNKNRKCHLSVKEETQLKQLAKGKQNDVIYDECDTAETWNTEPEYDVIADSACSAVNYDIVKCPAYGYVPK